MVISLVDEPGRAARRRAVRAARRAV
jgi:hypothetical protein